jgi:hypothetical protein
VEERKVTLVRGYPGKVGPNSTSSFDPLHAAGWEWVVDCCGGR